MEPAWKPACTHVALFCRNVEASVAFYARHVGLGEIHRRSDDATTVVWMGEGDRDGALVLVLLGIDPPEGQGAVAHLGYAVSSREDVDEAAARGNADGLKVQGPVEGGPVVGYYCLVGDPDGNWVEFSFGQSLAPD